jgi:predicted lipoprotein with Yx(FWY)xxD motif
MSWSRLKPIRYGFALLTVMTLAACGGAPAATTAPTAAPAATDTVAAAATDTPAAAATDTSAVSATTEVTATTEMTATAEMTGTVEATGTVAATSEVTGTPAAGGTPTTGAGVTVSFTQNMTYGMILVGNNGMTLYRFTKDTPTSSACSGNCAVTWPPLTVTVGTMPSAAPEVTGTLTVITRDDGSNQVAYNGLPLYFYAKDTKPGDTNGQGVGDVWYVVNITSTATMP